MALRPPTRFSAAPTGELLFDAFQHEIAGEKAASLGRAGTRVEDALAALAACSRDAPGRPAMVKAAAAAVHAYFIQREICGMRRHGDAIREYAIPAEVLARLGAS
jgi:hypothetical protein